MNLALSSDFPSTANHELMACIQAVSRHPRIAWVTPSSSASLVRFPLAKVAFAGCGIRHLECVAVGDEPGATRGDVLDGYDVAYLTGGDPVVFRRHLQRSGLATGLRRFAESGRLVVGASGGAMQLTPNVSLFRLLSDPVEAVVSTRDESDGLGLVRYEILPHLNRHDAAFLEKVRTYSESVPHDILALDDGAAVLCDDEPECRCFGHGVRYRRGVAGPIDAAT